MSLARTNLLLALALCACAEDLKTDDDGDASAQLSVVTKDKSDGVRETTVNASTAEKYRHFDLEKNSEVDADGANWDLALRSSWSRITTRPEPRVIRVFNGPKSMGIWTDKCECT